MSNLFNRIASVEIGPEGAEQRILSKQLRTVFSVKKTNKDKTANSATIEIYNLSEDTRGKISKTEDIVILKAGYQEAEGLQNVFSGKIKDINHIRNGPDYITRIESYDVIPEFLNEKRSLSYKEGTSAKQILSDIVKIIPMAQKYIETEGIDDSVYLNGFPFQGPIKFVLEKLSKKIPIEWSIQDNKLQILGLNKPNNDPVYRLDSNTGLVGIPEKVKEKVEVIAKKNPLAKNQQRVPAWKVRSLLLPKINIGSQVIIDSRIIKDQSRFRVVELEHNGDTYGSAWNTKLNLIDIDITEKFKG